MVRDYYIISFLIIAVAIGFFMFSFERKKPREREIVMLAVLISMAIVGRIIFFMTPQFKPCAAVIIVIGIMLGSRAGFLSGALTAFISDFFFGQGPWTPWQMIAFGLVGYLSAILWRRRKNILENRLAISTFGFLVTFVVYGLIMDTATVFMSVEKISINVFIATYLSGIIFNIMHGVSSFIFLFVLGPQMYKKISRINSKFSMFY